MPAILKSVNPPPEPVFPRGGPWETPSVMKVAKPDAHSDLSSSGDSTMNSDSISDHRWESGGPKSRRRIPTGPTYKEGKRDCMTPSGQQRKFKNHHKAAIYTGPYTSGNGTTTAPHGRKEGNRPMTTTMIPHRRKKDSDDENNTSENYSSRNTTNISITQT